MKRAKRSKLVLHRETLRQIEADALAQAAGGASQHPCPLTFGCSNITCGNVCSFPCTVRHAGC
jgi:hypothetical protein